MASEKQRRGTGKQTTQKQEALSMHKTEQEEDKIKGKTEFELPEDLLEMPDFEGMSKQQLIIVAQASFRGPLPHPTIMKGYEEVLPGSADRIITMVEEQGKHRRNIDKEILRIQSRDGLLGIICALVISLVIIGCGALIVIKVPSTAGVISGSLLSLSGVATVVGTFLKGTRGDWESKDNKDE